MPLAAGALIEAVAGRGHDVAAAWRAFAAFAALWTVFCIARNTGGRLMTPFATANMRDMITEAFARVQTFSAQWHSDIRVGPLCQVRCLD